MTHEETAVKMRELRARSGMSQTRWAEFLGTSTRSIEDWENARRRPPGFFWRYLDALDEIVTLNVKIGETLMEHAREREIVRQLAGRYREFVDRAKWQTKFPAPLAITLLFREPIDENGTEIVRLGLSAEAGNAIAWAFLPDALMEQEQC